MEQMELLKAKVSEVLSRRSIYVNIFLLTFGAAVIDKSSNCGSCNLYFSKVHGWCVGHLILTKCFFVIILYLS